MNDWKTSAEWQQELTGEARERWTATSVLNDLDATYRAAYNEANPAARSWRGMFDVTMAKIYLLHGKPGVAEMPAEANAISALIEQVMIAQRKTEPKLIDVTPTENE